MAFLPQGSSAQVAITAGQSIAVGAVRGGTANVTFPVGYPKGPSSTVNDGTETFGPFATATTVTVYASQGTAEYVTGTSPVCTDPVLSIDSYGVAGFNYNGISQPPSSPITTPVGYRGTTLATEMDLRRTLMGVVTNFDITSKIPTIAKTYYVDPINGSNANSGLTAPLAKKDLAVVLVIADCDQIIITGLTGDFVGLGAQSWNNVQPVRSLSVVNNTGYRYISCACASLPTWAVNGTYSNVYSTVIAASGAAGVTDLLTSTTQSYVNAAGTTVSLTNQPKRFKTLVKVASLAAVTATAGTWYHDGTSLHVRPFDGRNLIGDTKMIPTTTSQGGRFPNSVTGCNIYVKGLDFIGGQNAFAMIVGAWATATGGASGAPTVNTSLINNTIVNGMSVQGVGVPANTTVLSFVANTSITLSNNLTATASGVYSFYWPNLVFAHDNCSFQGSGVGQGLAVVAYANVYGYRSAAYDNYVDGFNLHSNESDGTTSGTSPSGVEIECVAAGNGTTGSSGASDNASTAHDYCNAIRLNSVYLDSSDRTVADTNVAHTWNLGCYIGQALTVAAAQQSLCALLTSKMWVDSCYIPTGSNARLLAANSGTMRLFNSGTAANDTTGEATGTVNSYYG